MEDQKETKPAEPEIWVIDPDDAINMQLSVIATIDDIEPAKYADRYSDIYDDIAKMLIKAMGIIARAQMLIDHSITKDFKELPAESKAKRKPIKD
jgi:chorismate mutase